MRSCPWPVTTWELFEHVVDLQPVSMTGAANATHRQCATDREPKIIREHRWRQAHREAGLEQGDPLHPGIQPPPTRASELC